MLPELGWRARLVDAPLETGRRLYLVRWSGDVGELIVGFDDHGSPIVTRLDPATVPTFPGFLVPADALTALANEVKPGPPSDALARVEEALAVERARIDDVLDRHLPPRRQPELPTPRYPDA